MSLTYLRFSYFTAITLVALACNKPAVNVSQVSTPTTQEHSDASKTQKSKAVSKTFIINDSIQLQSVVKTDDQWKSELNEMEYYVIREKGTERAFTGEFWDNKKEGVYICKACEMPLYDSKTKFRSGTGWPSYWAAIQKDYILEDTDYNLGYARTELMCARCEGHLGHVFSDGPEPTGERHCINSASLEFVPKEDVESYIINLKSQN